MRARLTILITIVVGALCSSLAFGNPAMLPKHPGYPIGNPVDPVHGQSLGNDPGQTNAFGAEAAIAAASAHDKESQQTLEQNLNDRRLLEKTAGQLPKVQGPDITIEPPVKEATRMK